MTNLTDITNLTDEQIDRLLNHKRILELAAESKRLWKLYLRAIDLGREAIAASALERYDAVEAEYLKIA